VGSPTPRLILLALALAACQRRRPPAEPGTPPAGVAESRRTVVRRAPRPPVIDGSLDDQAWTRAAVLGGFVDAGTGEPSPTATEVRLLWDDRHLFVAVESRDRDLLAGQDAVTLMVHGAAIGTGALDVEVTAAGTVSVARRADPGAPAPPSTGPFAVRAAVRVEGTIDRSDDQDRRWTAEVAIPMSDLAALACARGKVPPAPGDVWGLNVVRRDATRGRPPTTAAWSRQLAGDLHRLDQLGEMVFVEPGGEDPLSDEGREERERLQEEREARGEEGEAREEERERSASGPLSPVRGNVEDGAGDRSRRRRARGPSPRPAPRRTGRTGERE
jgi:hypothetical protein